MKCSISGDDCSVGNGWLGGVDNSNGKWVGVWCRAGKIQLLNRWCGQLKVLFAFHILFLGQATLFQYKRHGIYNIDHQKT